MSEQKRLTRAILMHISLTVLTYQRLWPTTAVILNVVQVDHWWSTRNF